MMDSGRGRKAATRARLAEIALEQFARDGFAETTVASIAEAAGVTERTFFHHFSTKLEAVFPREEYTKHQVLRAMIIAADPALDDFEVLCDCGRSWLLGELRNENGEWQHRLAQLRKRASDNSPVVRGMRAAAQEGLTEAMIEGLAARRGLPRPGPAEDILGLVVAATIHQAFLRWAEGDDVHGYEGILDGRLALLCSQLGREPFDHSGR